MSEADRLLAEWQQWYEDRERRQEQEQRQAEWVPFIAKLVANLPLVASFLLCLIWFF